MRIRGGLGISPAPAIGMEARQGRDSDCRGSVRSTTVRPEGIARQWNGGVPACSLWGTGRRYSQSEETRLKDTAYYYPAPYWSAGEGDWIKSLLLFFDEVAILLPGYMRGAASGTPIRR